MSSGSCWTEAKRANSVRPLTRKVGDVVLALDQDDEEEFGSRRTRKMLEPPSQAGRALDDACPLQEFLSALRPREGRRARTLPPE